MQWVRMSGVAPFKGRIWRRHSMRNACWRATELRMTFCGCCRKPRLSLRCRGAGESRQASWQAWPPGPLSRRECTPAARARCGGRRAPFSPGTHSLVERAELCTTFGNSPTVWISSCQVMSQFRDLPNSLAQDPQEQESDTGQFNQEAAVGRKGERRDWREQGSQLQVCSSAAQAREPGAGRGGGSFTGENQSGLG